MEEKNSLRWMNFLAFIFLLVASFTFAREGVLQVELLPICMPASYAFSIWILIYLLLGIWVIANFITPYQTGYLLLDYWFMIMMVFAGLTILVPLNISWIMIGVAFMSSIVIYEKLRKSLVINKYVIIPFSFLVGALSIATIVNMSMVLRSNGIIEIFGMGEIVGAIVILAIGTIIAIVFSIIYEDSIYPIVFIWGYIAIAVQNKPNESVVKTALIMVFILAVAIVYNWYTHKIQ